MTEIKKSAKDDRKISDAMIVMPTYNEAGNIIPLLKEIMAKGIPGIKLSVLVVDDSSPDGTGKLVNNFMDLTQRVHLMTRASKEGLGAAYIAGFKHAIKKYNPDIILEMDADFSHSPDSLMPMINRVKNGADFVIGSRYIPGGKIPEWKWQRRLISKSANTYAKLMLSIPAKDCTSGFRAINTKIFNSVKLDNLKVSGYAFQISLLHEVAKQGYTIEEVPITFNDRQSGKSKIGSSDITEFAKTVISLKSTKIKDKISTAKSEVSKFMKFGMVGAVGTVINTGVLFFIITYTGLHYLLGSAIATQTAIVTNYVGNSKFTFKGESKKKSQFRKFSLFEMISLTTIVGTVLILWLLTSIFGLEYILILNIVTIGIMFLMNFMLNRKFTWKRGDV